MDEIVWYYPFPYFRFWWQSFWKLVGICQEILGFFWKIPIRLALKTFIGLKEMELEEQSFCNFITFFNTPPACGGELHLILNRTPVNLTIKSPKVINTSNRLIHSSCRRRIFFHVQVSGSLHFMWRMIFRLSLNRQYEELFFLLV